MRRGRLVLGSVLLLGCILCGCSNANVEDAKNQVTSVLQSEDEHVLGVKNGTSSKYPGVTYGEAFEKFFGSPTWRYFEGTTKDENGKERSASVVEFTGDCIYSDVEVKACIQFELDKGGETFKASYLSLNDVPQNAFVLSALIDKVFTSALGEDANELKNDAPQETISEKATTDQTTQSSSPQQKVVTEVVFTQISGDALGMDERYIPKISCYSDGTFDFRCNFFEGTNVYTGTWDLNDTGGYEEYYFYIDNYDDGTEVEFYLSRDCEDDVATFYCPYDDEYSATFGATYDNDCFSMTFY